MSSKWFKLGRNFRHDYIKMKNHFIDEIFQYMSIVSPDGSYVIFHQMNDGWYVSHNIKPDTDNSTLSLFKLLISLPVGKAQFLILKLFRNEQKRMKYDFVFEFNDYKRCKYLEEIYQKEEDEIDEKVINNNIDADMDL